MPEKRPSLEATFGAPPFTVLDARQGYWQARKREWLALGIRSELGRGETAAGVNRLTWGAGNRAADKLDDATRRITSINGDSRASIFDPVLCDLAYRWFCPPGGSVLDPFAGGSVRGIVAAMTGHPYLGFELRPEQVAANREQAARICPGREPEWVQADSRLMGEFVHPDAKYDLVFSCPPYGDLERYSDDPRDLSAMGPDAFRSAYREIIALAAARLRHGRFAVFVVGDYRGKDGFYAGLPGATIAAFEAAGCRLYNHAILVTAVSSLSLRAGRSFADYRKLGKAHQDVLIFFKGNPADIPPIFGDMGYVGQGEASDDPWRKRTKGPMIRGARAGKPGRSGTASSSGGGCGAPTSPPTRRTGGSTRTTRRRPSAAS